MRFGLSEINSKTFLIVGKYNFSNMMNMQREKPKIAISNTFTQDWEMESYIQLANQYGYRVHTIIVENRHGGVNVHDVPDATLGNMRNRFSVKL
mgnify:CR=1 FL=1